MWKDNVAEEFDQNEETREIQYTGGSSYIVT